MLDMARMKKSQIAEMNNFFEEMDAIEGMEKTYTDAVDYPEDTPLIEEGLSVESEEDEEYTEEDLEMFLENVSFESSNTNLSFDEMMPQQPKAETGIKCQLKENIVQPHFLTLREWVERSPSVCPYKDCFYDGSKAIGFKKWDKVTEKKKKIALAALEKHTQLKHKFRDTDIVDKAQIPTSWLSPTL